MSSSLGEPGSLCSNFGDKHTGSGESLRTSPGVTIRRRGTRALHDSIEASTSLERRPRRLERPRRRARGAPGPALARHDREDNRDAAFLSAYSSLAATHASGARPDPPRSPVRTESRQARPPFSPPGQSSVVGDGVHEIHRH